ncbi:MAG TPA: hypothetical protein VHC90_12280 [Bryobacteraceae bacterium]|nr:hypothetical protein [Bryobacteraceae bacterium]
MTGLARVRAVLKWLARAAKRNRRTFRFTGNNMHYTAIAMLFMLDPAIAGILLIIMGVIVLLPMSSDPLRAIPPSRGSLWPLDANDRRLLRFLSPFLNPMTWLVLALAFWKRASWGIVALAGGTVLTGFFISAKSPGRGTFWRTLPRFPSPLNQLIRKNLREMLSTLDFATGALIAVASLAWRVAGMLPKDAFFPITFVAMLAISTCAISLFGLDGGAGLKRYRLLPIPGWQILLAKDLAFIAIALLIALPLYIPAALAAALIALATGHRASIQHPEPQLRWRFQTGPSFGDAITQIVTMTMAGAAVAYSSVLFLLPCVVLWGISVWWFGRDLDRG